jgi:alpha-tubulin suppressor-like RCC1 family protein
MDANGKLFCFGYALNGLCGIQVTLYPFILFQPTPISLSFVITKISAGALHNLILDTNGNVYCFGDNMVYSCGSSTPSIIFIPTIIGSLTNIIDISASSGFLETTTTAGQYHSLVVTNSNQVYGFGSDKVKII